jgi:hypothetical protein
MSEPKGPHYIKKVRGIRVWHIRHPQIVGWLEARKSLADAKHTLKNMNDAWLAGYAARGSYDQENEA